jgi:homoserine kinase
MRNRTVKTYAPASISNLGAGFDVIGVAIERPGDYVTARRTEAPGIDFTLDGDGKDLPIIGKENVACHVASLMIDELRPPFGIKLTLHKRMPIGSGLGSSAASSVAAVMAVNALLSKPLKKPDLLRFAIEGERKVTNATHGDNVAPSLFGGACIVRNYDPIDIVTIPIKNDIVWAIIHPKIVVRTQEARALLPESVPLQTAVRHWGNVGGLSVGLMTGNAELLGKCTEDLVAEPVRAHLIPGFHEVRKAAFDAGAFGCTLSGSGPSMFAVTASIPKARKIARAMQNRMREIAGIESDIYVSRINKQGAQVVARKGR